jgi:hypothetical protein
MPNDNSLVVYSDASFPGEWAREVAPDDPTTARSRTGYVILFGNCPVLWSSKLQTDIAHWATEAEYAALFQSLKETISLINILLELQEADFNFNNVIPKFHCKLFEDNAGAIEMTRFPK